MITTSPLIYYGYAGNVTCSGIENKAAPWLPKQLQVGRLSALQRCRSIKAGTKKGSHLKQISAKASKWVWLRGENYKEICTQAGLPKPKPLGTHGKKMLKSNDKIALRLLVCSGWGNGGGKDLNRNRSRDFLALASNCL